ncbi:MAG: hypothetical protein IJS65_08045 [Clostridia bacterium]|nr:hypothetical protein [Clostridia bacterium]
MEKLYGFREKLCAPHKEISFEYGSKKADELDLTRGVCVCGETSAPEKTASSDLSSFLSASFGVKTGRDPAVINIVIDKDLGGFSSYKGRVISVRADGITVRAFDGRGAAQALYDLEEMMKKRKAPYIKTGEYAQKPLFSPRIVHSAYDLDIFPDAYLQNLVRDGFDALAVYVDGVGRGPLGEYDFSGLIERAARYGLDVYAYSRLKNFNSPHAPGAAKTYADIYAPVFRAHDFKGMIFVGESVEFLSDDPHVDRRHYYEKPADGIPTGKQSPGWYPCADYKDWLILVRDAIREVKPDADIVFWTYNWGWCDKAARLALIDSLPTDITLMATFEMFENYGEGTPKMRVCDYSLAFEGPGEYFKSEALAAKRRGIKLYAQANSAGKTWDFGNIPYEPFPQKWLKRYENMVQAQKDYGLSGVMECHHYGVTPSFITEMENKCFSYTRPPFEEILKDTLSALGDLDACEKGFAKVSAAMDKYPAGDEQQYCAMRVGTAYPLSIKTVFTPPDDPDAPPTKHGKRICRYEYRGFEKENFAPHSFRVRPEINALQEMAKEIKEGTDLLERAQNKSEELREAINLLRYIACVLITAVNVKKTWLIKQKLTLCDDKAEYSALLDEAERIAREEIKNSEESIEYARRDSAIGCEPSMGYWGDERYIRWKIKTVEYMLEKEIPSMRKALEFV